MRDLCQCVCCGRVAHEDEFALCTYCGGVYCDRCAPVCCEQATNAAAVGFIEALEEQVS